MKTDQNEPRATHDANTPSKQRLLDIVRAEQNSQQDSSQAVRDALLHPFAEKKNDE